MKEHLLPEERRITDKLPAADRPSLPVAMPDKEEWPLPCGFTPRSLQAVGSALVISLGLFWYGAESIAAPFLRAMAKEVPQSIERTNSPFWAVLAGGSFLGGALGAVIGKASLDDKGVAHIMGAFVGALAGPLIVLILLLEFLVLCGVLCGGISV